MFPKIVLLLLCLTIVHQRVESASKYYQDDEERPYEFGFTIDGQQHRHEKKDANGIIQGEFGFITADGVYHVTVYATDENGNFKILSMRNIKLSGPLDEPNAKLPDTSQFNKGAPQPNPLSLAPSTPPPTTTTTLATTTRYNGQFTTQPTIKPACAGCGYVTLPPKKDNQDNKLPFQTPAFQNPKPGTVVIGNMHENAPFVSNPINEQTPVVQNQPIHQPTYPDNKQPPHLVQNQPIHQPTYPENNQPPHLVQNQPIHQPTYPEGQPPHGVQNQPIHQPTYPDNNQPPHVVQNQPIHQPTYPDNNQPPHVVQNQPIHQPTYPEDNHPPHHNDDNHLNQQDPLLNPLSVPENGITVADGMINVPNNPPIPIKDKYPNMQEGLPPGIDTGDITDLLYKFNYTVGFHGHYEKGYRNGAKVGGYFVTDRDGVSRVVTYVADENGYRPKVKFIRLDLNSDLVPKEGTEKTFGLKNFEFVWYPLN